MYNIDFECNYSSTVIVEYLKGYTTIGNEVYAGGPIWETLGSGIIAQGETNGRGLLCRLRKTNSITTYKNPYELPMVDEYFILGAASSVDAGVATNRQSNQALSPGVADQLAMLVDQPAVNVSQNGLPVEYLVSEEIVLNGALAASGSRSGGTPGLRY